MATKKQTTKKQQFSVFDIRTTDEAKEQEGIWVDYGPFAFKIRRMGPGNTEFTKMTDQKLRPYQAAIRNNAMDEKIARKILVDVFCRTVLVGWRKTEDGVITEGILPDGAGKDIPFSVENAIEVFTKAKGALDDLLTKAAELENFKADEVEETAKN